MKTKYSVHLKQVINTLKWFIEVYDYNMKEMKQKDLYTSDLLHIMEFGNISYSERRKLATKLKNCRIARRECKDIVEELEPIVSFIGSDYFKTNMNKKLENILGEVRKAEKNHQNRVYYPRTPEGKDILKEYEQK